MADWQTIRYPQPLRAGDAIGITAPSSGVVADLFGRLDLCIGHLRDLGFEVIEGACLRQDSKHVSAPRAERAADLQALWEDDQVKAIIPPWGGEIAVGLLACIDFDRLAAAGPKWILGYSDTSTLLFALTVTTGIATAHGPNLMEMIPNQSSGLSRRWRDVLALAGGERIALPSSPRWQMKGPDWRDEPAAKFNLTEETRWRCLRAGEEPESLEFHGRIIGGCLETLAALVGTPYGDIPRLRERVGRDGLILFLENADSDPPAVCRMLWNMRLAGWFDGLAGLVLGRSGGSESEQFTYLDALHDAFDDLPLGIIYDADIGHKPPQMTIVNGALASVTCADGQGGLVQTLA